MWLLSILVTRWVAALVRDNKRRNVGGACLSRLGLVRPHDASRLWAVRLSRRKGGMCSVTSLLYL